jgi:hypothetical protein
MRLVGVISSTATLSLFTTIAAMTVVHITGLQANRGYCAAACTASLDARLNVASKIKLAVAQPASNRI